MYVHMHILMGVAISVGMFVFNALCGWWCMGGAWECSGGGVLLHSVAEGTGCGHQCGQKWGNVLVVGRSQRSHHSCQSWSCRYKFLVLV